MHQTKQKTICNLSAILHLSHRTKCLSYIESGYWDRTLVTAYVAMIDRSNWIFAVKVSICLGPVSEMNVSTNWGLRNHSFILEPQLNALK